SLRHARLHHISAFFGLMLSLAAASCGDGGGTGSGGSSSASSTGSGSSSATSSSPGRSSTTTRSSSTPGSSSSSTMQPPPPSVLAPSTGSPTADLGGLAGADKKCQDLATTVGAGSKTWRAYLSVEKGMNGMPEHAKDRIGKGPWYNAKLVMVAANLDDLHKRF